MTNTAEQLQVHLFQEIKSKLPPALSLVDEVAQALNIGTDSAYRRIRGEKPLTFDELYQLCTRYGLSLDQLFNNPSQGFLFQGGFVEASTFRFDHYLQGILQQVKYIHSFAHKHLYYLCKDIPLFHHFHFKELAAFKQYFWMKTIVNHPAYVGKDFSFAGYDDTLFALGKEILRVYNEIPSTEVWNRESINSTLQQIEFYRDTRMFASGEDVLLVYEALEKLVHHLQMQAETGYKFDACDETHKALSPFHLYYNEVILGDNSILGVTDKGKTAFLVHSVINVLMTHDPRFCDNTLGYIQNLLKKSTQISVVSERERSRFFRQMLHRIEESKQGLKL